MDWIGKYVIVNHSFGIKEKKYKYLQKSFTKVFF